MQNQCVPNRVGTITGHPPGSTSACGDTATVRERNRRTTSGESHAGESHAPRSTAMATCTAAEGPSVRPSMSVCASSLASCSAGAASTSALCSAKFTTDHI